MIKIAIIGETGVYLPDIFSRTKEVEVSTPYGVVNLMKSQLSDATVFFSQTSWQRA